MSRIGVFDRETGLTHYLAIKPDNTLSLEYLQCSFPGATGIYTRGDDPDSIFPVPMENKRIQCDWDVNTVYYPLYPSVRSSPPPSRVSQFCRRLLAITAATVFLWISSGISSLWVNLYDDSIKHIFTLFPVKNVLIGRTIVLTSCTVLFIVLVTYFSMSIVQAIWRALKTWWREIDISEFTVHNALYQR